MKIGEILSFEAPRLLGKYLTEQTSPEDRALLLVARDALLFISELGQDYRFEDYRRGSNSSRSFSEEGASVKTPLSESTRLVARIRGELPSPEDRELACVLIDALDFIVSTGQHTAFVAFRRDALAARPPHLSLIHI